MIVVPLLGFTIAFLNREADEPKKPPAEVAVEQQKVAPVSPPDLKQKILDEVQTPGRMTYINGLRESFRNAGFDASVSDLHGDLTVVSDALKLKPDRDEFVRRLFGPAVRGCREGKEEKAARLDGDRTARENYVDELRGKLGSNMNLQELNNELVLTSASANDLTPAMIRANWGAMFTGEAGKNLCSIGFRGFRVGGTVNDTSTFISFGCGK